jgi:hypothetical protein
MIYIYEVSVIIGYNATDLDLFREGLPKHHKTSKVCHAGLSGILPGRKIPDKPA